MDGCPSPLSPRCCQHHTDTDITYDIFYVSYVSCSPPLLLPYFFFFKPSFFPAFLSHPHYLLPPSPLFSWLGILGGDKFRGGQAEGGQTRSLCDRIVEQETGPGGGSAVGR